MSHIERKAIQPRTMALEGGNVQAMQQFIDQGEWQDEKLLHRLSQLVDQTLGEDDGVYIVDELGLCHKSAVPPAADTAATEELTGARCSGVGG